MRFKIDENLPSAAAELLQAAGFDVRTVQDQELQGSSDEVIADAVRTERRVLITLDRGFGDIRAYPPSAYAGIIVLRPKQRDKEATLALLKQIIPALTKESLDGTLWIVEPDRIRFHKT